MTSDSPPSGTSSPQVLTDIPARPGSFWGDNTAFAGSARLRRKAEAWFGARWGRWIAGVVVGLRLFLRQRRYVGIVTGGESASLVLALLQWMFPFPRARHVMIAQLYRPRGTMAYRWKRLQMTLAARSVHRFVVWASHEVEDYARVFGIPREKIAYVPFHHTLGAYQFEMTQGDYLFSGGNYDRDYGMLVTAVRDLDIPVWIAATRKECLAGVEIPRNVRVQGTTHDGFRRAMAGARMVVVAMQGGLLHSGGQQTLLNAMAMRKPVIAVGERWAKDLMTHGEQGLIVDYGDVVGLRNAIEWILRHPTQAEEMARRAREHALPFTAERTMRAVYGLAVEAEARPGETVEMEGGERVRREEGKRGR